MSSVNLQNLPIEVLEKIFNYLGDLKDLSLVCKNFYKIICKIQEKQVEVKFDDDDLSLTKEKITEIISTSKEISLNFDLNPDNFNKDLLKFLEEFSDKIYNVKLKESIYESDFYKLIKFIKNHQTLKLCFLKIIRRENENFDAENFYDNITKLEIDIAESTNTREWSERFKSIDEFKLKLFYFNNTINFIKKLKYLKVLRIFDRLDYGEIKLNEILQQKQLEELELTHLKTIGNDEEIFRAILSQRNLKVLKIKNLNLWNEVFEEITEKLKNLTIFEVNLWLISSFIIRDIEKLKNLVNLEVKIKNFDQLEEISKLKLQNLKNLKIHHHGLELDPKIVKNISRNFLNLFSVGFCGNLLSSIDAIFTNFNHVQDLHIYNQNLKKSFKDQKFFEKSHKNENLKKLLIYFKTNLNDKLREKISNDFPNLEILMTELNDPVCADIWNSHFQYSMDFDEDEPNQDFVIDNFEDYMRPVEDVEIANFDKSKKFSFEVSNFDGEINDKIKDENLEKFVTFELVSRIENLYLLYVAKFL
ncbi:hypothetical protein PVAND_017301 [Polypedilum vanderplanki]|uniref:F-box domain-containing protein n=1 Tax=Polypedilum vanderplanki TaxID=319348 RepID=A0A9J6BJ21_POLVA|nr:hypothetical protein PVAND_017301 [Polypedilum vanderplanki]